MQKRSFNRVHCRCFTFLRDWRSNFLLYKDVSLVFLSSSFIPNLSFIYIIFFISEYFLESKRNEIREHAQLHSDDHRRHPIKGFLHRIATPFESLHLLKPRINPVTGRRSWQLCDVHCTFSSRILQKGMPSCRYPLSIDWERIRQHRGEYFLLLVAFWRIIAPFVDWDGVDSVHTFYLCGARFSLSPDYAPAARNMNIPRHMVTTPMQPKHRMNPTEVSVLTMCYLLGVFSCCVLVGRQRRWGVFW